MGKEGSAPVPSAHDRKAVPAVRPRCPSVAGQEKKDRGRGVESGRGVGEEGFSKERGRIWRQLIVISYLHYRSFRLNALQSFHLFPLGKFL